MKNLTRSEFMKAISVITVGSVISPHLFARAGAPEIKRYPICVFTKCLQFLDYDRLGETLAKAGFDGADLSVRKGGHVLPEHVKTDLPKAVKALQRSGIKVPMMVTRINNPDDPDIENILGTASALGISHYRMGYLGYDAGKSIQECLDKHKKTIERLEKINRKFGIHGEYQNHTGTNVGSPLWDLYWILKDSDPAHIGSQYDIRHAVCEGGNAWPLAMRLLAPWIKTTAIKDFLWKQDNGKWKASSVPLGEGMVDYDAYLQAYARLGIAGPVSIHYEYALRGPGAVKVSAKSSTDEIADCLKKDLIWLKKKFSEHGI